MADEPTPGLHLEAAKRVLTHFREIADEGAGVLLITHDLELALEAADRIVVFYAGTNVEEASVSDFEEEERLRHPYTKALFRAMPQHGFVPVSGSQPYGKDFPAGCPYAARCELADGACCKEMEYIRASGRQGEMPQSGLSRAFQRGWSRKVRQEDGIGYLKGRRQEVTGDMKLEARELSFRYDNGNRQILNKMSMTLESTDRLGLIAPSGFGKTTFCKILAGYEEPDSGEVLLEGKPLSAWKGYCPVQMIWQHPELSVNPRWKMGEVLKEGDQVEKRIIDGLGIELDWLNRYPSELSGGELQRFCIARALGQRTRFLLADEISTMLDLITQSQLWNFLLEEVKNREIGLMAVSHSEVLLERICTKIVRLNG